MSVRNRLKSSVRSAVRPLWLIVWRRLEARIRSMGVVPGSNEGPWQQHVPAFLNAVSTIGAFGHELLAYRKESLASVASLERQIADIHEQMEKSEQVRQLEPRFGELQARIDPLMLQIAAIQGQAGDLFRFQHAADARASEMAARIEFVRREMLYEFKYGGARPAEAVTSPLEPQVVSTDKFAAACKTGPRINLGCGHIPLDGYLNVDMRALPGVDIIAEVGNVPFQPGTVREIHSAHLLEHFPQEDLRKRLLPYWHSLLGPGGTFSAIVPDGESMLAHFAAGDYPFEQFREVLFGAQDYNGDFHFNMFLPQSLQSLLDEAGFVNARVPVKGRANGICYEFEINAQRA